MKRKDQHWWLGHSLLFPIVGISLFAMLYLLAASVYPGGSDNNHIVQGFSLMDNYWCDLMSQQAKNGRPNPGYPIAVFAWAVLCLSLSLFWLNLPKLFDRVHYSHRIIQYSGLLSTVFGLFLFTGYHDRLINIAAVFGAIALLITVIQLRAAGYAELFGLSLFCFLLAFLNYLIFKTSFLIEKLPVIQKIAFVFCLVTFSWIELKIYRKAKQGAEVVVSIN